MNFIVVISGAVISVLVLLAISVAYNLIPSSVEGRIYIFVITPLLGSSSALLLLLFLPRHIHNNKRYKLSLFIPFILVLFVHFSVLSGKMVPVSFIFEKKEKVEDANVEELMKLTLHRDVIIRSAALQRYLELARSNRDLFVRYLDYLSEKYGREYVDRYEVVEPIREFAETGDPRALKYLNEMSQSQYKVQAHDKDGNAYTKYPNREFAHRLINKYYPQNEKPK